MHFDYSDQTKEVCARVEDFMDRYILPNEQKYYEQLEEGDNRWKIVPILEEVKQKAKDEGLWNYFLPESLNGAGLTNLEYAPVCEIMGRVHWASEAFNCSAPDTGNMEVLERYGTPEHKKEWLEPLLNGEMRSAFAMTEPAVASSDATNIECRIERDGDEYVINGRKWWTSGIGDPRCKILILMGKTDPSAPTYRQQSMILVPRDTAGIKIERMLNVMGFDDAPHGHGEVLFKNVRVPASNLLLGEGRGFEIAQGRLGPGRIHHCMRIIGVAERALEMMCERATQRVTWDKPLAERDNFLERVANARINIEMCRLLTLKAAYMMDTVGNKEARQEIAMIKVAAPNMALQVIDDSMQAHGGGAMSQAFKLSYMWSRMRALRFADGPDEVHRQQIAKLEMRRQVNWPPRAAR
jgi:acyl-CoA dehydrogenase